MPPRIGLPAMRLPIVTMRLPSAILESPCARGDRELITPEVWDWLKRVVKGAEKRNEAMHAVAQRPVRALRRRESVRAQGPPGR